MVSLVIGVSAMLGLGLSVYRLKPALPSWTDIWPAQVVLSEPAAESPAGVADVHPTSVPRTARSVPITPTPISHSPRRSIVGQSRDRADVGNVLVAPVATSETGSPAPRVPRRFADRRATTQIEPTAVDRSTAGQSGSAVAFIASPYVYSALDGDVVPPETILPQKLGNLRTGAIKPDDKVTLEVVVNEQGIVEAAWGRTSPRNVGESLLLAISLHAVKSWMFYPALRNGVPVPYRKLITFEGY